MSKEFVGFRLEPEQVAALDRIAATLSARPPKLKVSRSMVARAALDRGIEAMDAELGTTAEKKGAPPTAKPSRSKK